MSAKRKCQFCRDEFSPLPFPSRVCSDCVMILFRSKGIDKYENAPIEYINKLWGSKYFCQGTEEEQARQKIEDEIDDKLDEYFPKSIASFAHSISDSTPIMNQKEQETFKDFCRGRKEYFHFLYILPNPFPKQAIKYFTDAIKFSKEEVNNSEFDLINAIKMKQINYHKEVNRLIDVIKELGLIIANSSGGFLGMGAVSAQQKVKLDSWNDKLNNIAIK